MNILGGVASVTQLAAYSHVVAKRLIQLHKAAQEGPSFCRAQRFNIGFLLESIQRISADESPNTDSILPLLIATANLATLLLKLLKPRGTFYNYLLWASKGQEIEHAFHALNDKTRLLQLHISERTYNIMTDVRREMETMNQSSEARSSQGDNALLAIDKRQPALSSGFSSRGTDSTAYSTRSTTEQGRVNIISNGNEAKGQQYIANGWGGRSASTKVESSNNKSHDGQQTVANAKDRPM